MLFKLTSIVTPLTLTVMASALRTTLTARDVVCVSGPSCSCADTGAVCTCRPEGALCNMTQFCGGVAGSGCV
ncbi:hypothetical protein B0H19DRAFT_1117333 [Mycena capillaripes]|nr:hypothetical protein B0H19DRAFT_1117333 [Mycena capillaripes]